jgi:hypothetical protein
LPTSTHQAGKERKKKGGRNGKRLLLALCRLKGGNHGIMGGSDGASVALDTNAPLTANPARIPKTAVSLALAGGVILIVDTNLLEFSHLVTLFHFLVRNPCSFVTSGFAPRFAQWRNIALLEDGITNWAAKAPACMGLER